MGKNRYQGKYLRREDTVKKKTAWGIPVLLVLFFCMMLVSGWRYFAEQKEYEDGADVYEQLAASVVMTGKREESTQTHEVDIPHAGTSSTEEHQTDPAAPAEPAPRESLYVDFDQLKAMNGQSVAWISGCDGAIHYPVVQTSDNEYYLDHLFDGTKNRNGAIFMDFRNADDLTDQNTFLYGHNMRNGAMFAALTQYGSQAYYDEHPEMTLVTPERTYILQAFSGYVTVGNSDIYQLQYRDEAEFASYLERVRMLSDFSSSVEVTAQDRIVTLSTWTYDYEDDCYVLHCRLIPMQ